jgi:hypothetical protein
VAFAAALVFGAFIVAKGIPTLRHDWSWPIDRTAIGSFLDESVQGWLSTGFGTPNPHPTTYLIGPPIAAAMWIAGPLAALFLFAALTGYVCTACAMRAALRWNAALPAALGIGLFAVFNPWVYNEVVAGHLVMVLAYGAVLGLITEMTRGAHASTLRLTLWIALIQAQLQLFILAMLALVIFAVATKKWQPPLAGIFFALPSIIGLVAERGSLLQTPYSVTWQTNQSLEPVALLGLGGYFPGYADRLGVIANAAVWVMLALALVGLVLGRRPRVAGWALFAAVTLYVAALGVYGPFAGAYEWIVRNVPVSGVFRELYDLAGCLAAVVIVLASIAVARVWQLGYLALAAGVALPILWLVRPPSDLWVGAGAYPHPDISAPAFARVAFSPAFQPLALRNGDGGGADPNVHLYPGPVAPLNQYFPTYPVDMALARYEQSGETEDLRALGVAEIVNRPWLVSVTRGEIGLAARSLQVRAPRASPQAFRFLNAVTPLISTCDAARVVTLSERLGTCDLFFGDVPGYASVRPIVAASDSIDPRIAWIDARLVFAKVPDLAQAFGGAMTQSRLPYRVESPAWLLVYVRGKLTAAQGQALFESAGAFTWLPIPASVASVVCEGLCALIAQTPALPNRSPAPPAHVQAATFARLASWLYVVSIGNDSGRLLRLDERYDRAWTAIAALHVLPHVRVDATVNGWFVSSGPSRVILLQVTALLQLIAEALGVLYAIYLLKALVREPTKRA